MKKLVASLQELEKEYRNAYHKIGKQIYNPKSKLDQLAMMERRKGIADGLRLARQKIIDFGAE